MQMEILGKSWQCLTNATDYCDLETLIAVSTEAAFYFQCLFLNIHQFLLRGLLVSGVWGDGVAIHWRKPWLIQKKSEHGDKMDIKWLQCFLYVQFAENCGMRSWEHTHGHSPWGLGKAWAKANRTQNKNYYKYDNWLLGYLTTRWFDLQWIYLYRTGF